MPKLRKYFSTPVGSPSRGRSRSRRPESIVIHPPVTVTISRPQTPGAVAKELELTKSTHPELGRDIRTDLTPTSVDPPVVAYSPVTPKFTPFFITLCTGNDKEYDPRVTWIATNEAGQGGIAPWPGHYVNTVLPGNSKSGFYPVHHNNGDWYEVGWDSVQQKHFAFADARVRFPFLGPITEPQEAADTTAFTSAVGDVLIEVAAQQVRDPSPVEQDPAPSMATRTVSYMAPGRLGVGTGGTFASIARINPDAPAEPRPDSPPGRRSPSPPSPQGSPRGGGGGPPGGGGGPPGGGGGPFGGGPPGFPGGGFPGFNLAAPAAQGDAKLVGQPPTTFAGKRDDAEKWMLELENYHFLNRASPAISNQENRVSHALTLIKGPEVDGWVRQRMKWLMQVTQGHIAVFDAWRDFRDRFLLDFSDITAAQKAQNEIMNLRMGSGGIDAFIVKFEELAEKAGFDMGNPATAWYFMKGLPIKLLEECLKERPIPVTWADWKQAARMNHLNWNVTQNILNQRRGTAPFTGQTGGRRPFNFQRRQGSGRPQASAGTESVPMDVDRLRKVTTEAEKARLLKEGRCFECQRQGHIARNCPNKKRRSDTRMAQAEAQGSDDPPVQDKKVENKLASPQEIIKAMHALDNTDYDELSKLYDMDKDFVNA
jgi:hypothetical protein